MVQLMPLPLTVSCFSKIQIGCTFLVPAHLGSPGQRAVKWVCVVPMCTSMQRYSLIFFLLTSNIDLQWSFAVEINYCYYTTLHSCNGLFSRTTWVSWYQTGKTSLDLNMARHDGVWGCSDIIWAICKQSAPSSRHITTPTPHHSIFTSRMLFMTPTQKALSKH